MSTDNQTVRDIMIPLSDFPLFEGKRNGSESYLTTAVILSDRQWQ